MALLYYILLIPLSLLPMRVLYVISDGFYVLLYKVFGYRKKVVQENLRSVFPEKSEEELLKIEKSFYHHLCDLVIESLMKSFTISESEIRKRMVVTNPEVIQNYFNEGRSVLCTSMHYANWEWGALVFGLVSKHNAWGIYQKLENAFFDKKVRESRGKFGTGLISTKEVGDYLEREKENLHLAGFIADQSPGNVNKAYWLNFLGKETAVSMGSEAYARKYNMVVAYGNIQKLKRGYYTLTFEIICENPLELKEYELIEKVNKRFEQQILQKPDYWLWSHKRWKHKRNPENLFNQNGTK